MKHRKVKSFAHNDTCRKCHARIWWRCDPRTRFLTSILHTTWYNNGDIRIWEDRATSQIYCVCRCGFCFVSLYVCYHKWDHTLRTVLWTAFSYNLCFEDISMQLQNTSVLFVCSSIVVHNMDIHLTFFLVIEN